MMSRGGKACPVEVAAAEGVCLCTCVHVLSLSTRAHPRDVHAHVCVRACKQVSVHTDNHPCTHAHRITSRSSRVSSAGLRARMEAAKELSHDILQAKTALADPRLGLDFDRSARGRVGEGNMRAGNRVGNRVGNTEVRGDSRSGGKGIAEVYDHDRSCKRTCAFLAPPLSPPLFPPIRPPSPPSCANLRALAHTCV